MSEVIIDSVKLPLTRSKIARCDFMDEVASVEQCPVMVRRSIMHNAQAAVLTVVQRRPYFARFQRSYYDYNN